jgi:uncharacterized protein YndB with AHSA1/START domain
MMPVKKDAAGRRFVQAEVEVPGSPEEVWQAIATGPGLSSWFVPAKVDGRVGGVVNLNFGPGMDSVSTITAWDPPRRFAADSNDMGPDAPTVATEWIVETRSGGTCVVRVVHSWFASTDDWDNQFEGHEHGWPAFFRTLRMHLSHFRGQSAVTLQLMGMSAESTSSAWNSLTGALGLSDATHGQRVMSTAGAPRLAGIVERVGPAEHPELLLRLDEPAPGTAHLFAMPMGGHVCLPVRLFLYGERAADVASREEGVWESWINERFPAGASAMAPTSQVP